MDCSKIYFPESSKNPERPDRKSSKKKRHVDPTEKSVPTTRAPPEIINFSVPTQALEVSCHNSDGENTNRSIEEWSEWLIFQSRGSASLLASSQQQKSSLTQASCLNYLLLSSRKSWGSHWQTWGFLETSHFPLESLLWEVFHPPSGQPGQAGLLLGTWSSAKTNAAPDIQKTANFWGYTDRGLQGLHKPPQKAENLWNLTWFDSISWNVSWCDKLSCYSDDWTPGVMKSSPICFPFPSSASISS